MRISDWSSDVCSSDLLGAAAYAEFRGAVDTLFDKAAMLAAAGGPDVPLGDLLAGDHTWRPAIEAICGWITGGRLAQVSRRPRPGRGPPGELAPARGLRSSHPPAGGGPAGALRDTCDPHRLARADRKSTRL